MDYTIIGSQVNIAARLEGKAHPGQILISHETWSLVKDKIHCLKDEIVSVKGISHPIQTYQVTDFIENISLTNRSITAEQFVEDIASIDIKSTLKDAYILLDKQHALQPLAVTDNNMPCGIITRYQLLEQLNGDIPSTVYLDQPIKEILLTDVIVIDAQWPIDKISERFIIREESNLFDPVLVTENNELKGYIPAYKLIKYILGEKE